MTRLGLTCTAILGLASLIAPPRAAAQEVAGVTGAAEATLPNGATFNGIPLRGLTLGQGVSIAGGGSATGQFQVVLLGTALLGTPQNVTIEGEVSNGTVGADGSATFGGTATVDLGDGTLPLPGVPFSVAVSTGGLALTLNGTALPSATISAGSVTIK